MVHIPARVSLLSILLTQRNMLEFQPKCLPQEMKKTTADVKKKVQKLSNSKCCRIFSIVLAPTWATDDYYIIIRQEIEFFSENCYNPKVPELQN